MNKHLNKLYKDSLVFRDPKNLKPEVDYKKFAELIVRECAAIADIAADHNCESISGNILTHFGYKHATA